jgi:hypothetical protein
MALLLASASARADRPMKAPPAEVESPNHKFLARLDPAHQRTSVFRRAVVGLEKLWEMTGQHSVIFLSDNPDYLVSAYRGGELLSLDHAPDEVMLRFYQRGRLLGTIRLPELIHHPERLPRTVSHRRWCQSMGLVDARQFAVVTSENRRYLFDVTTGQQVSAASATPPILFDSP